MCFLLVTFAREHVRGVSSALEGRGSIKAKKLTAMTSTAQLAAQQLSQTILHTKLVTLKDLKVGANPAVCVCVKVVKVFTPPVAAMACLIVIDGEGRLGAMSLFYIEPANLQV